MAYKAKDVVKLVVSDGASVALEKMGRSGMSDIGGDIDRNDYTEAFTLTRAQ